MLSRCFLALGLAVLLSTVALAQKGNRAVAAAQKDIVDLADTIKDGKTDQVADKVAAIKRNHSLDNLMKVFKIKEKGGLGIEIKIIAMQRGSSGPAVAVLKKEAAELTRMGHVTIAMAEIAHPHYPGAANNAALKKKWADLLNEQKKASEDFVAAVKAQNSKAVKIAATKMQSACTTCHSEFRK